MSTLPSLAQLKQAVQLCEQIEKLQLELEALLATTRSSLATTPKTAMVKNPLRLAVPVTGPTSRVSAQGSQRIAAAQRRRWARFRLARQEAARENGSINGHGNGMHKSAEESAAEN